ncbi:MAG: NAD(P)-binding protein [Gammaproteobacteria bacterium]|nr:NAD(P)-binding protein [Gammaproteobacteria bacterium]MDE0269896.1 NAD(P)-binding protein [Gammaproteobacteria bacterium]
MARNITRRDFLNGAAIALAAGATLSPRDLLALEAGAAPPRSPIGKDYYPPTLTGMRGSHDGSFEVAHALAWRGEAPTDYALLDERHDLVVVGAGLSGLAAAYLYRQQAGPDGKILILDNHDDFGGHAKRNEFHAGGRMLLGVGGSLNLEHQNFSETVHRVLRELGVDLEKLEAACEPGYFISDPLADLGYYLNAASYGQDRIVQDASASAWLGGGGHRALIESLGLPGDQGQRLLALIEGERDLLDELSLAETKRYIDTTSYQEFLSTRAGLAPATIALFEPMPRLIYGLATDCISVTEALMFGLPGLKSLGLTGTLVGELFAFASEGVRYPMFPDGNASVARLLVRNLIAEVAPGSTMEDVVNARFDYSRLDRPDSSTRLRLNSTAVKAVNVDDGVEVSYVEGGKAYTVRAGHCVLACYNRIIPHLCPELPESQKENLKYAVKTPFAMANVLLRSGAAVNASGIAQYFCPGSFFEAVSQAPPVSLGGYPGGSEGDEPMVLWMAHMPAPRNNGQQNARELYRLGQHRLYTTPFAAFETEIRNQLAAMFGPKGFDADRDIEAITVNRWSHGYAYEYLGLYDPDWDDGQAPHELGRKPFGRISIANSDAEGSAYLHAAIDAAARAVNELGAG